MVDTPPEAKHSFAIQGETAHHGNDHQKEDEDSRHGDSNNMSNL